MVMLDHPSDPGPQANNQLDQLDRTGPSQPGPSPDLAGPLAVEERAGGEDDGGQDCPAQHWQVDP